MLQTSASVTLQTQALQLNGLTPMNFRCWLENITDNVNETPFYKSEADMSAGFSVPNVQYGKTYKLHIQREDSASNNIGPDVTKLFTTPPALVNVQVPQTITVTVTP